MVIMGMKNIWNRELVPPQDRELEEGKAFAIIRESTIHMSSKEIVLVIQ